jgi:Protein of unknown function (DUF2971)
LTSRGRGDWHHRDPIREGSAFRDAGRGRGEVTGGSQCEKPARRTSLGDQMTLPPLYKYLDVQGARLTLQNKMFEHAKPSTFNDIEELTIRSLFPEDDETALKELEVGFTDTLLKHLDDKPTCLNLQIRMKVALLLRIFKANPELAKHIKEAKAKGQAPEIFNVDHMKKRHRDFIAEINLFMQGWRVLCVSTLRDSERMWIRYADEHKGIVLRILPNLGKDSKYQLFRPVVYRERRPSLYESASSFQESSLFGDQQAQIKKLLETIIYSKTLEWEYECEYRFAIPLGSGEKDWNLMPYHPEEISELYMGAKATEEQKAEFAELARGVNPQISVFEAFHDQSGKLSFRSQ